MITYPVVLNFTTRSLRVEVSGIISALDQETLDRQINDLANHAATESMLAESLFKQTRPSEQPPVPPDPEPEPGPVVDINIFVKDPASVPIPGVTVTSEGQEPRSTSGDGHCHFGVTGPAVYHFEKEGWESTDRNLPPGEHTVHLTRKTPPAGVGLVKITPDRALSDDSGPFLGRDYTDMSGVRLFEKAKERYDRNCQDMAIRGANMHRILTMVGWPGREIDPRSPGHIERVIATIDRGYELGLRAHVVYFADCNVLGMKMPERRDYARKMARSFKGREHKLAIDEVCNEPGVANYNGPWTADELIEIGRIIKEELPNVPMTHGAPAVFPDGGTTWEPEGETYIKLGQHSDLCAPHFDRDISKHDGSYRPIRQTIEGQNFGFAYSNNEPIGVRSSVASETNPGRLRAAATFTYVCRGATYCYHTNDGVGANADGLIASNPGADDVFDCRRILAPDTATFKFTNWHRPENVWETVDGSLSDKDLGGRGTMRTVTGEHADGRIQTAVLLVTAGATLRARRKVIVDVFRGGSVGPYEQIHGNLTVPAGGTIELAACTDAIIRGRLA